MRIDPLQYKGPMEKPIQEKRGFVYRGFFVFEI